MSTLKKFMQDTAKKQETFDPNNKYHLIAYYALKYEGKKMRSFELELPFVDILHMMEHKIARKMLEDTLGTEFTYDY